jgi:diguanylate cyclase (GGDEF)-like protein
LLHGLDPGETLQEVMWTEIFRALAEGETCVREIAEGFKASSTRSLQVMVASKVLILGKEEQYSALVHGLSTSWPAEIELIESPAGGLEKAKRMVFDAAVLDLEVITKDKLLSLTREIREVPGQEALPLAFVTWKQDSLSQVDLAYAGCSHLIIKPLQKEAIEQAVDKLLSSRQLQKPRILTVDDDEVLTKFISTILSVEGMFVEALNKPIVVMEAIEQFKPDLVLLDVIMPGLSGYDVCRMIKNSDRWRGLPIVFLTSKSDQEGRAAAFQAGGDDFLSKPVLAEELITRVNAQLNLSEEKGKRVVKDQTTGALSGADFMKLANEMLDRARECDFPMTFALVSLDEFVKLSFTHKWTGAQSALVTLGKLLQSRFKAEDLRGRFGEDAYVLTFPGENMETMGQAIEKLLKEFADIKLPSETIGTFKTTFSAGLSEYPADGETIEGLLDVANQRLLSGRLERRGVIIQTTL